MKTKREMKADPGKELTMAQLVRFVDSLRGNVNGEGVVKATVRFNGTLRGISVEWDDVPDPEGDEFLARQY